MNYRGSFSKDYFEKLYSTDRDNDPWRFGSSGYERSKYETSLKVLEGHRLGAVFEVGCSIGIFTRMLASHCESVLAADVSEIALTKARANCEKFDNVTVQQLRIPAEWPTGRFDLIILSEILYFLGPDDIRTTARKSLNALTPSGRVLLVNWLGETDYPCGGDEAAELFFSASRNRLKLIQHHRNPKYRLDLLTLIPSKRGRTLKSRVSSRHAPSQ
jgi:cyclopropane fatty-acyl-phospholipid synthase-like methyltransferase